MTSPLFAVASADFDTDKDARGENARRQSGGERRGCKRRKREKVGKGERDADVKSNILLRF